MVFEDIAVEHDGAIATITLNRPDVLNAARRQTHEELCAAFDAADRDNAIRAIIVTGAGRAFCAGTDISGGFRTPAPCDPATGEGSEPDIGGITALRLYDMRKPVICAVNGAAAGFGATVTLPMDFRLASTQSKFLFPFCRRGIAPESCASWFLPRIVGITKALDWVTTGRVVTPAEALEAGLVNAVLPPEDLLERAREIATEIATRTSAVSVALSRRLLWRMLSADDPRTAHELESRAINATLAMPDVKEGAASFREKRLPRFTSTADDADFMKAWWSQP